MAMTPRELETVAEAAFGDNWKSTLPQRMEISRAMLWHYLKGNNPISDEQAAYIRQTCLKEIERRIASLQKIKLQVAAKL